MRSHPGIHIFPRRFSHPAIQMASLPEYLPLIAFHAMCIPQCRVRFIRIDGIIDGVLRPGNEEDGDTLQTGDVAGCDQGGEERAIGGDNTDATHVHEMSEGGHGGTSDKVGELVVCCNVEVAVGPQTIGSAH